jgi:hypothetical protein
MDDVPSRPIERRKTENENAARDISEPFGADPGRNA